MKGSKSGIFPSPCYKKQKELTIVSFFFLDLLLLHLSSNFASCFIFPSIVYPSFLKILRKPFAVSYQVKLIIPAMGFHIIYCNLVIHCATLFLIFIFFSECNIQAVSDCVVLTTVSQYELCKFKNYFIVYL